MTRATTECSAAAAVIPSRHTSFASLDSYVDVGTPGQQNISSKGWGGVSAAAAAARSRCAAAAAAALNICALKHHHPACTNANIITTHNNKNSSSPGLFAATSPLCCMQNHDHQEQQQHLAQLFTCCDATSVDALLLALLSKMASEHPQLLEHKMMHAIEGTEEKEYAASFGMSESDLLSQKQEQQRVSSSLTAGTLQQLLQQSHTACSRRSCCRERIVVIGLQCHSTSRDAKLLEFARRHLLQPNDVVVVVSCWELATDPKYVRVPGMILSATSAATASYNRQQQQQMQQRMRHVAEASLKGQHVYCLAVPVSCMKKTSVGDLLCRVSRELHADAILLGARSHWQLTRMLFGSVAGYAKAHASCPVVQCGNA